MEKQHDASGASASASPPSEHPWHTLEASEAARLLQSDINNGLSATEAESRLARYGANTLGAARTRAPLRILLHQFRSVLVLLLAAASAIAFALGDAVEAIAILLVILLNATVGFVTEWQAARALDGLRRQEIPQARVRRDGNDIPVAANALVPGDVILLGAGDRVPADARVIESASLRLDESSLTGESLPSSKSPDSVEDTLAALGDRSSVLFAGTVVTAGRGTAITFATGMATETGRIGTLLDDAQEHGTPLERKLSSLNRVLLVLVVGLCAIIVLAGWLRGHALMEMVRIGVSLAIAAVPEGLLAVTTMTLAMGMRRMARMNALVRRLPAVEALGSTTVICTDKTGTLTRNEMTVRSLQIGSRRIDVSGSGYAAEGTFSEEGKPTAVPSGDTDAFQLALRIGALCNDSKVDRASALPKILGDPTEGALRVVAEKAQIDLAALEASYPRLHEIPFSSDTKRMLTVHRTPQQHVVAYAKGSPAALLEMCGEVLQGDRREPMTGELRAHWGNVNNALAEQALRVLALGYKELPEGAGASDDAPSEDTLRDGFVLVGYVAMSDPLRDGVGDTIATCRAAGIRVIMVTGDQEVTAAAIARELGLDHAGDGSEQRMVHARELGALDEQAWQELVRNTSVLSRVSPADKVQLVTALQRNGEIVAMTGDGVNDAPALKSADIGIAMGIRGTDVAKEAADMVITDDDFSTIVKAVEQGRMIVNNILRFIHYLFSCNFAELIVVFVPVMIGWPLPLGVLQILWLNMLTDIFPALALALEPSAPDVMTRQPRDPHAPLMTWKFGGMIAWQGGVMATATLVAFRIALGWYGDTGEGLRHAETIAFMTLALAQVFHAFNARSVTRSIFAGGLFTNGWLWGALLLCFALQVAAVLVPMLRVVLDTTPVNTDDAWLILAAALSPVVVVELVKLIRHATRTATTSS